MVTFVEGPVRVSVPATSANLGPGFDSLGLALALFDDLEGEVLASGLVVEVEGAGAGEVPLDESHLVVRSMRAAFELLGEQPPGLRLACRNVVPHARGLGSSSAAIVGGVVLARALVAGGELLLDDDALLRLAAVPKVGGPGAGGPKAIAGLFFAMFCLDISALIYGPPVHYALAMVVLGWGQWALLLAWGFPLSLFRKRLGENPAPEPWSIFDLRNKAVS